MQQLKSGSFLQGGKYRIEKVLGQGGFGITYLATQELLNRKVAIKEFFYKEYCERDEATSHVSLGTSSNRELVERFMEKFIKEARTISALNHPHIIRIYDIFKENNTAYYVMEYIEGMSLAEMVKQQGALSEDVAIGYIRQVASALDFVHQHSINHLDVKPANIMVRKEDNQAVLIDFGLSKQYDASGEQTSTTPVGISHGYAPMEQYNVGGVGTFSPQTDIYSLGATLYKLVTGNTPPQAGEVLNEGLPELPSYVSSSVADVIKKAMQPRKVERYNNVKEFVGALNQKVESDDEEEETIAIQDSKQHPDIPKKNEKGHWWNVLWCIVVICFVALLFYVPKACNDYNERIELKERELAEEMKRQRINDSIVIVRRQEAEQRRKDSIDALNEQARLATVRKLEEEKKRKEQEMNIDRSGYVNGHEAVDLGLSVRWATCNIGATYPWEYGDYYAWGEKSIKTEYTMENSIAYNHSIDMKSLASKSEYDVAYIVWGKSWRLPTIEECEELIYKCKWIWTTLNKENGYKIVGKNGNYIFLPAAGWRIASSHTQMSQRGNYWTSSTDGEIKDAKYLWLEKPSSYSTHAGTGNHYRMFGLSIRPVTE